MRITDENFFTEGSKYIDLNIIDGNYKAIDDIDLWFVKDGNLINKEGCVITNKYTMLSLVVMDFLEIKNRLFYDTYSNKIYIETKKEFGNFAKCLNNCNSKNSTLVEIK